MMVQLQLRPGRCRRKGEMVGRSLGYSRQLARVGLHLVFPERGRGTEGKENQA